MICLFEIAGQMNAEDDPMLKKIVSAALPNLPNYNVKVLAVSPFSSKEHGAKREFHPMFKPFVILFVGIQQISFSFKQAIYSI